MGLLKLYIKGPKDIALQVAKKHDVDIYNLREVGQLPLTVAEVMDYKLSAVMEWHGETANCHHDRGNGVGTLLIVEPS